MMCLPDELTVVDAHSILEGNVAADACLPLPEFDDRHPVISRRRRPENKDRTVTQYGNGDSIRHFFSGNGSGSSFFCQT
jgi:hypothetical protein